MTDVQLLQIISLPREWNPERGSISNEANYWLFGKYFLRVWYNLNLTNTQVAKIYTKNFLIKSVPLYAHVKKHVLFIAQIQLSQFIRKYFPKNISW